MQKSQLFDSFFSSSLENKSQDPHSECPRWERAQFKQGLRTLWGAGSANSLGLQWGSWVHPTGEMGRPPVACFLVWTKFLGNWELEQWGSRPVWEWIWALASVLNDQIECRETIGKKSLYQQRQQKLGYLDMTIRLPLFQQKCQDPVSGHIPGQQ